MAKKKSKAAKKQPKKAEGAARNNADRKLDQVLAELVGIRAELKRLHNMVRVVAPSTKTAEDVS